MEPAASKIGSLAGRYLVFDVIASGGMATIHLGRLVGGVGFARTVAIKRLHPHLSEDPEFRDMFLDEARLAAHITHPNVVQTLDVVDEGNELFIVMEYIHGISLARLFKLTRKEGGLPPDLALSIMRDVLQGMHAAHEACDDQGNHLRIVHRDVSPQNILVGMDGRARLIDFGVAKAASQIHTTREGQLKGKLAYMAPEQIREGLSDRQTDVFSAAVVLWEALANRRLFHANNDGELIYQLLERPISPPSTYRTGLETELDAVVLRGLERKREARFSSARDLLVAAEQAHPARTQRAVAEWMRDTISGDLEHRTELLKRLARQSLDFSQADIISETKSTPSTESYSDDPTAASGTHVIGSVRTEPLEPLLVSASPSSSTSGDTATFAGRLRKGPWLYAGVLAGIGFVVGLLLLIGLSSSGDDQPKAALLSAAGHANSRVQQVVVRQSEVPDSAEVSPTPTPTKTAEAKAKTKTKPRRRTYFRPTTKPKATKTTKTSLKNTTGQMEFE